MYAIFKAELINGSAFYASRPRPWVARLTAIDHKWGFVREFVKPLHDFTHARPSGNRGIYAYFSLAPGAYEIYHCTSWRSERRFFALVSESGDLSEVTKHDVTKYLGE